MSMLKPCLFISIFLTYVCWLPWIIECAIFKKNILFIASVLMPCHYFLYIISSVIWWFVSLATILATVLLHCLAFFSAFSRLSSEVLQKLLFLFLCLKLKSASFLYKQQAADKHVWTLPIISLGEGHLVYATNWGKRPFTRFDFEKLIYIFNKTNSCAVGISGNIGMNAWRCVLVVKTRPWATYN